jgi:hypothetical protein
MDYTFPWFSYEYMENSHNYITIDWVVPPMPKAFFRPRVQHGGKSLLLTTVIPSIFFNKDRLVIANSSGTISYSQNMNKATAFERVVRKFSEQHLEEDEAHDDYKANPQVVPLPYPVEQTITSWEVQAFPYQDNAFLKDLSGDQQYVFVLSATLKKIETRRSTRNKGIFRIFKTPSKSSTYVEDDDMDDEYEQIGVRDTEPR